MPRREGASKHRREDIRRGQVQPQASHHQDKDACDLRHHIGRDGDNHDARVGRPEPGRIVDADGKGQQAALHDKNRLWRSFLFLRRSRCSVQYLPKNAAGATISGFSTSISQTVHPLYMTIGQDDDQS